MAVAKQSEDEDWRVVGVQANSLIATGNKILVMGLYFPWGCQSNLLSSFYSLPMSGPLIMLCSLLQNITQTNSPVLNHGPRYG